MKIAHVVSTFPPRIGGMGKVCFEEAKELAKRGHEVTVFTLRYPETPPLAPPLVGEGVRVVRLRPVVRAGDAGWVPQLYWKLKGFDIIHLHYPFYGGAHCVWLARLFWKQKYVVTYHMDAQPEGWLKKIIKWKYDFLFARAILRRAEKVVGIEEVAPGVNAEIFKPSGERTNKKTILFAANLMPIKRLDLLLQAVKLMDENVTLLVVGGGYSENDYKKMAEELGIKNRVVFAGRCDSEEKMAEYYNSASCLAIPSRSESFSLSAVEAMACGCPVVARDMPAMRGRVTPGVDGWLVDSDTPEDWAHALGRATAITEETRRQMGEAGRKKVLENYNWQRHVDALEKIYAV